MIETETTVILPSSVQDVWVERYDADAQFLVEEIKAYKKGQWDFWPWATLALVVAGLI